MKPHLPTINNLPSAARNASNQNKSARVNTIEKFFFSDEARYTTINNQALQRDIRDFRALGIYAYLCSLPDDWKIMPVQLASHFNVNVATIRRILKILIEAGYLFFLRLKTNGRFSSGKYLVFQSPLTEERKEEIKKMFPQSLFVNVERLRVVDSNNTNTTKLQRTDSVSEQTKPSGDVGKTADVYKKSLKGGVHHCVKSDYYRYCIKYQKPWTEAEIEDAWKVLMVYDQPLTCWQRFLDGIIEKGRNPCSSQMKNGQKKLKSSKHDTSEDATEVQVSQKQTFIRTPLTKEFKDMLRGIRAIREKPSS